MAKQLTLRQRLISALQLEGWGEVASKTSKAVTMVKVGETDKMFIGKMGSLRYGQSYTTSFCAHERRVKALLDKVPNPEKDAK